MSPEEFIRRYQADWERLEALLVPKVRGVPIDATALAGLAADYRRVCQQLELARERHYPLPLIERLNALVVNGQARLYAVPGEGFARLVEFIVAGFPRQVRAHPGPFWLALLLFAAPLFGCLWLAYVSPEFADAAVGQETLEQFDEMYSATQKRLGKPRDAEDDVMMFGFYIYNNIKIGFQTFAGGLLYGVGSAFFLLFNAVQIGTVAGHVATTANAERFFSFVVGHGAFELTAIVLAGMAGLMLGRGIAFPGNRSRAAALRAEARAAIAIVGGMALFLLLAAFLEAFWSSSTLVPPKVKYVVGGALWLLVLAYLIFAGRGRGR
jgi:uncharacterized membrane protein SpoIIM required for sporulation